MFQSTNIPSPTSRSNRVMNTTWDQVRKEVRAYRSYAQPSNLTNIKDFCFDERNNRAYFLATDPSRMKTSTLFVADLPHYNSEQINEVALNGTVNSNCNDHPFTFHNNEFQVKEFSFTFCPSTSNDTSSLSLPPITLSDSDGFNMNKMSSTSYPKISQTSKNVNALSKIPAVEWKPLLPESWLKEKSTSSTSETLSREETFIKERRRLSLQGITSYQFDPISGQILFSYGSGIYLGHTTKNGEFHPRSISPYSSGPIIYSGNILSYPINNSSRHNSISPISSPSTTASSSPSHSPCCSSAIHSVPPRLDPKLGGHDHNLVAFIRDRDIWVTTPNGCETQLTFCNDHDPDGTAALSCGVAEFVMQEEFHRFSGYYWAPPSLSNYMKDNLERILYLQISESMVDLILISRPGPQGEVEEYRYPKAGTPNAVSDLQIVEFIPRYHEEEDTYEPVHKRLWGKAALDKRFPWMEYIVRFGWCPNGKSVWVQFLDRLQKRTAIVKIPICNFMSMAEYQQTCGQYDDLCISRIEVVFEESSDVWINVTDICYFFNDDNDFGNPRSGTHLASPSPLTHTLQTPLSPTKLFLTSESSGFRHLYLVVKPSVSSPNYHIRTITSGNWPIVDKQIYVDTKRQLVYFTAKKDTPLETHLYVASYSEDADSSKVIRLTELGYSHIVVMDVKCERYLDWFSSISEQPRCSVRYLVWDKGSIFPRVSETIGLYVKGKEDNKKEQDDKKLSKKVPLGEFFDFINNDGVKIYGCLYRPENYVPGKKYPTLLSIYGGPKSQMVTNDYKYPRLLRLFLAIRLGFAVVLIDGRGSSDRGLAFESFLKGRMGTVEIEDQIAGLNYLATKNMGIDLERVAITGWSYGGYLSLMALAQYPHVFKLAIAGAPVTQWELYDTAYTERYMGLPSENPEGYRNGSVLTWADKFPDSENRLLVAHGQIDENVHFKNSELLVSALVKHNKPHMLQPYPTERHGLKHASVAEHFETLMFFWLVNYL
ncbi:8887_t:CDS:10 [Funneliformis caledonium]|uniref:8887_t:CDS:1 n=1 Tax=Funneliformis caledonium TaxID=1117310 RepID=A0A9N9FMP7_9GLOM|nr:8887_t:CDS:10 [Funneliformis caledonium]